MEGILFGFLIKSLETKGTTTPHFLSLQNIVSMEKSLVLTAMMMHWHMQTKLGKQLQLRLMERNLKQTLWHLEC